MDVGNPVILDQLKRKQPGDPCGRNILGVQRDGRNSEVRSQRVHLIASHPRGEAGENAQVKIAAIGRNIDAPCSGPKLNSEMLAAVVSRKDAPVNENRPSCSDDITLKLSASTKIEITVINEHRSGFIYGRSSPVRRGLINLACQSDRACGKNAGKSRHQKGNRAIGSCVLREFTFMNTSNGMSVEGCYSDPLARNSDPPVCARRIINKGFTRNEKGHMLKLFWYLSQWRSKTIVGSECRRRRRCPYRTRLRQGRSDPGSSCSTQPRSRCKNVSFESSRA